MAYRVAQWGTGLVGKAAVRTMLEHPQFELVGCFAHSKQKVGMDVGTIVGTNPVGILATDNIEDIIALKPDIVLYMPLVWSVDDMSRMLRAGINVISTANFITGRSFGQDAVDQLERSALEGGVTLYGTGINPGLLDIIALTATSGCGKVYKLMARESVDATAYASAATWLSNGFGGTPDAPGLAERVKQRGYVFVDVVEMLARALKVELDEEIGFEIEFGVATEDLHLGYMDIAQGTVCGLKKKYLGTVNGETVIELQLIWRLGNAMEPDWQPEGYVVEIEGEPSIKLKFHAEGDTLGGGMTTAMTAMHAIPVVCGARPGIVTADELPLIRASWSVRPRALQTLG